MSEWISIDKFQVAKAKERSLVHGTVKSLPPPHLVPGAVKAERMDGWIIVNFRYNDSISERIVKHELEDVTFERGKNTQRIYRISFREAAIPMIQKVHPFDEVIHNPVLEARDEASSGITETIRRYRGDLELQIELAH